VRMVLENAGTAVMGIGSGTGDNRAEKAAQQAISSPYWSLGQLVLADCYIT